MTLTFAVTNFNRFEMLLESFAGIIDDPRIDEIVIMDDHSEDKYWTKIKDLPKFNPKIKVVRQLTNRGMSENKRDAVFNSKNDWVLLADSDNKFTKGYIDALYRVMEEKESGRLTPEIIYCPSFAAPNFDYRKYQNMAFFKSSFLHKLFKEAEFSCLMNTANYVVNREEYILRWQRNESAGCADTIWMNYLWLKAGNGFFVVPGMEYQHRVHPGSGFLENVSYNMAMANEFKNMITAL